MLTALTAAYDRAVFWASTTLFCLVTLAWSTVAALLYPLLPTHRARRVGQFAIMAGFRFYLWCLRLSGRFHCDLGELDRLRGEDGLVIAPNHPALIDVVLITSRLPRITCIMKAQLWDNPLLGGGARLARYIRNDSPTSMVKLAVEEIRQGSQLLVFPEGTRTVVGPVNPFKGGFALIAKRAGVPIQTVFIETNSRYLGKGWPIYRMPRLPLFYRVRLGPRFQVDRDVKAFTDELEAFFREQLGTGPVVPALGARRDTPAAARAHETNGRSTDGGPRACSRRPLPQRNRP
jgi:1-acyl-sn-glycerol-3-phosphate acyltransferase